MGYSGGGKGQGRDSHQQKTRPPPLLESVHNILPNRRGPFLTFCYMDAARIDSSLHCLSERLPRGTLGSSDFLAAVSVGRGAICLWSSRARYRTEPDMATRFPAVLPVAGEVQLSTWLELVADSTTGVSVT